MLAVVAVITLLGTQPRTSAQRCQTCIWSLRFRTARFATTEAAKTTDRCTRSTKQHMSPMTKSRAEEKGTPWHFERPLAFFRRSLNGAELHPLLFNGALCVCKRAKGAKGPLCRSTPQSFGTTGGLAPKSRSFVRAACVENHTGATTPPTRPHPIHIPLIELQHVVAKPAKCPNSKEQQECTRTPKTEYDTNALASAIQHSRFWCAAWLQLCRQRF